MQFVTSSLIDTEDYYSRIENSPSHQLSGTLIPSMTPLPARLKDFLQLSAVIFAQSGQGE